MSLKQDDAPVKIKTIVIKLGGSSLQNNSVVEHLAELVQKYRLQQNTRVVVVHGGGPAINAALTERGITWTFIGGQRVTTPQMIETIEIVLKTNINGQIVDTLKKLSIPAVGISGNQEDLLVCEPAPPELERVGRVVDVNASLLEDLLRHSVPVVAPLGVDTQGLTYNINADWAAAKVAIALKADEIIYLTDQKGIWDENKKVLSHVDEKVLQKLIDSNAVVGGMLAKTQTIITALLNNVPVVRILHAEDIRESLTTPGLGTTCAFSQSKQGSNYATL